MPIKRGKSEIIRITVKMTSFSPPTQVEPMHFQLLFITDCGAFAYFFARVPYITMSTSYYVPKLSNEDEVSFVLSQKRLHIRDNDEVQHLVIPSRVLTQRPSPPQLRVSLSEKDTTYSLVVPVQDQGSDGGETISLRRTRSQARTARELFASRMFRTHERRIPIEIWGYYFYVSTSSNERSAINERKTNGHILLDAIISNQGEIGFEWNSTSLRHNWRGKGKEN